MHRDKSTSQSNGYSETFSRTVGSSCATSEITIDHYLEEVALWCRLPMKSKPNETAGDFARRIAAALQEWRDLFDGYLSEIDVHFPNQEGPGP